MAIQQLLTSLNAQFPNTNAPALNRVNGTNAGVYSLAYDDTTSEEATWQLLTNAYAAGNLRFRFKWHAATATTGAIVLRVRLSALTGNTDSTSIEARTFGTAVQAADTHLGTTAERVHTFDIDLDSAAELNSMAADDDVIVGVARLPADAGDTMAGDLELDGVEVFEI